MRQGTAFSTFTGCLVLFRDLSLGRRWRLHFIDLHAFGEERHFADTFMLESLLGLQQRVRAALPCIIMHFHTGGGHLIG